MSETLHEPNNDRFYRNPRAWWKAKQAFGPRTALVEAMEGLERLQAAQGGGCVRFMMTTAINLYLESMGVRTGDKMAERNVRLLGASAISQVGATREGWLAPIIRAKLGGDTKAEALVNACESDPELAPIIAQLGVLDSAAPQARERQQTPSSYRFSDYLNNKPGGAA